MNITVKSHDLLPLSTSTVWVDSSQRKLKCKGHRNQNKHDGIRCTFDTVSYSSVSRRSQSSCNLYHEKRRLCRKFGCYFDISSRQCFTITQAPSPKPSFALIQTALPPTQLSMNTSPSAYPSLTPSKNPSSRPTAKPITSEPSRSPSVALTASEPIVSPSAPFVIYQAPTKMVTQNPTLPARTQTDCSLYHRKPRRCVQRGCLFEKSTLECTNGKPTSAPSVSPSIPPTHSAQPTNKHYRVRLYWEQGYMWQEDPTEKWYCWACAQCEACSAAVQDRTSDCVDVLCDIKSYCIEGMTIAVTNCAPNRFNDKSASFSILTGRHGLFDNLLEGDQIQVANSNLCLSLSGVRSIALEQCDSSKIEQRFTGFPSEKRPMELSPVNNVTNNDGVVVETCLTQHHHPRVGERIFSEECKKARSSETSLWDLWTLY